MGVQVDAAKLAIQMGREGADNRLLMDPKGHFTKQFDTPPSFTREDIAQHTEGTYAFAYWNQQSDKDPTLQLVIEGIDCANRRSTLFVYPMKRPKPGRYPALMKLAGEGEDQPGPHLPPVQTPRYRDWGFERFLEWAAWKVAANATHATKEELTRLAGLGWICGDRDSSWLHAHSHDSGWQPTTAGVYEGAGAELTIRGHRNRYQDEVGGQATFVVLWWPAPGGAVVLCGEPATGAAAHAQLMVTPERGLLAKLAPSNEAHLSPWQPSSWHPVGPPAAAPVAPGTAHADPTPAAPLTATPPPPAPVSPAVGDRIVVSFDD